MTHTDIGTDQGLLDHAVKYARTRFETCGEVLPMFLIVDAKEDITMAVAPWGSQREKEVILDGLAAIMMTKGAQRYAFMSEVWGVTVGDEAELNGIVPSLHAEREEFLMVLVASADGKPLQRSFYIDRSAGKPRLTERSIGPMDVFSGRLVDMLKRRPSGNTAVIVEKKPQ